MNDQEDYLNEVKINITTSLPMSVHTLAKQNKIGWSDALIFGIKFILADKDGFDYPNNTLVDRLKKVSEMFEEKCNEIDDLRNKLDGKKDPENKLPTGNEIKEDLKLLEGKPEK